MTLDVRIQAPACSSVIWRLSLILVKIRPSLAIEKRLDMTSFLVMM